MDCETDNCSLTPDKHCDSSR